MQENTDDLIPDKFYFRIGEVSDIARVDPSVLRFWETEFDEIRPKRTSSGQRLYRKKDVHIVLTIKELLYNQKFTIQGAKQHLKKRIKKEIRSPVIINSDIIKEIREQLEMIKRILNGAT
mmetsp:Transcript_14961/g.7286  ORF Transcript_14961/g.7286 Transcript_14961/m.7286 type:complete len:120 (+) Transcript_14961:715-1074(+)